MAFGYGYGYGRPNQQAMGFSDDPYGYIHALEQATMDPLEALDVAPATRFDKVLGSLQESYGTPWGRAGVQASLAAPNYARGAPAIGQGIGGSLGSLVGQTAGAGVGATMGGTLGSVAGPVGTAVGGYAGSMLGDAVGGLLGDDKVEEAEEEAEQGRQIQQLFDSFDQLGRYYRRKNASGGSLLGALKGF